MVTELQKKAVLGYIEEKFPVVENLLETYEIGNDRIVFDDCRIQTWKERIPEIRGSRQGILVFHIFQTGKSYQLRKVYSYSLEELFKGYVSFLCTDKFFQISVFDSYQYEQEFNKMNGHFVSPTFRLGLAPVQQYYIEMRAKEEKKSRLFFLQDFREK